MSKSLDNTIGITEAPSSMFGKIMSISDDLMWRYYELLTDLSLSQIQALRAAVDRGERHPMDVKTELGRRIVTDFHSPAAAEAAIDEFTRVFRRQELPTEAETCPLAVTDVRNNDGSISLKKLLYRAGLAESVSDAERKIKAQSVKINGTRYSQHFVTADQGNELIIQVGKRSKRVVLQA
jgi:tyrosyl-tRNA synthetase